MFHLRLALPTALNSAFKATIPTSTNVKMKLALLEIYIAIENNQIVEIILWLS